MYYKKNMIYIIGFIIAIFFVLFICGNGLIDRFGDMGEPFGESIENMVGFVNNKNRFTTEKSYDYLNPANIETVPNVMPIFEDNMMFNQSADNLETLSNIRRDSVSVYGNPSGPIDFSGYHQQNHKICSCVDNKCECKSIMKTKENLSNMIDFSSDLQKCKNNNNIWKSKYNPMGNIKLGYGNSWEPLANMVDFSGDLQQCYQNNKNIWKSIYNPANNNENFYNPSYTQQLNSIGNMMLGNMKGLNIGTDYVSPKRTCMRHFGPDGDYQSSRNVTYHDDLREHDLRKLFNAAMSNKYQVKGIPSYNKQYCNKRLSDAFKYCQLDGACINNTLTDSGCSWQYM